MSQAVADTRGTTGQSLALTVLQDKIYSILLTTGPKKTGEIVGTVGHSAVNLHLAKYALRTSERFTQTARKWDITARWEPSDTPFEKLITGFVKGAGHPLSCKQLGRELAKILGRDEEAMAEVVRKFAHGSESFAKINEDDVLPQEWILDTGHEKPEDILFYNFLKPEDVDPLEKLAAKQDWEKDPVAAAVKLLSGLDHPVPIRAVAYHAWVALGDDLDSAEFYELLLQNEGVGVTSEQYIYKKELEGSLLNGLKALVETVRAELAEMEEEEEGEDTPPTLTDAEFEDFAKRVEEAQKTVRLADLILQVFEIEEGEKAYKPTAEALMERLKHDPRVMWFGGDRFRSAAAAPQNVSSIPESLIIPEYDFANIEGERFDLEMEIAGLESAIAKEIHEPLVQDVGDEDESQKPAKRPTEVRCVVKYHHKQAGTFPIAQLPDGFLAEEPSLQELVLRHEGREYRIWANLQSRLIYGLDEFYNAVALPISGGVFVLRVTDDWNVFDVEIGEEDEVATVSTGRLLDLLSLKEEADNERLPTFEVLCRILSKQPAGMSYPHLFIELNLIRRVSRKLVASLLSGYACFSRNSKTGMWTFDEKKKDQGFIKSKRKYVVKES